MSKKIRALSSLSDSLNHMIGWINRRNQNVMRAKAVLYGMRMNRPAEHVMFL